MSDPWETIETPEILNFSLVKLFQMFFQERKCILQKKTKEIKSFQFQKKICH